LETGGGLFFGWVLTARNGFDTLRDCRWHQKRESAEVGRRWIFDI
jgi:hypothetical protein